MQVSWRAVSAVLVAGAIAAACSHSATTTTADRAARNAASINEPVQYPHAPTVDQFDDYNGVVVADPYRWLEDPDSGATKLWVQEENKVTFGYLEKIAERPQITRRMTKLWDYERYGVPSQEGGRYFFTRNNGLQNQSVLYTTESLSATPRVLLDPNTLSADGTVALSTTSVSDDGALLAYGVADGGSDWIEFRVRDVRSGKDLPDVIKWAKFTSAAWTKDNQGFFYSRYDEPKAGQALEQANYYQKLYYHRLGTPQAQDRLVYQDKDHKDWGFSGSVTDDGQFLIISVWQGTERKNMVYYQELSSPGADIVKLIDVFDAQYNFIDNDGPVFWFFTDKDAPRGRVIAIDTRAPAPSKWKEVIPQAEETLRSVNAVAQRFLGEYLKDARSEVRVFGLDGKLEKAVDLPGIGSANGFGGKRTDKETFYSFTSFTTPGSIYRYDVQQAKSELWRQPKVDFDASDYETKQVFYRSKDGTKIPMFLTYKKGLELNGQNPTHLYGYGGFNIPITPSFSVPNLVWMEMGGVLAVANLRGGGEYGKAWHDAGRLSNKQNVFDDFIAAAEWLIENKYTSTPKLAISGRSNGGLLVGACMTQRPDLFGACLPGVGVMDMLRFNKFTIGWAWVSDYGSPEEPNAFKSLYAYSPLHNIRKGTCYPPTMITTADHDDRVVPAHSFKFAAALQAAQGCDNPILIRIETRAGHGAGKPTTKQIEEWSDQWAFLAHVLGMKVE